MGARLYGGRICDRVDHRRLAGFAAGALVERYVSIQRHVFESRGGLYSGDNLPCNAEFGKLAKTGKSISTKVSDRLHQSYHSFLNDVVVVGAHYKVCASLGLDQWPVASYQEFGGLVIPLSGECNDLFVLHAFKAIDVEIADRAQRCFPSNFRQPSKLAEES